MDNTRLNNIPEPDNGCVLWHCRQLRTADHPGLEYCAEQYDLILPLFIFDPAFYGDGSLACDSRIEFLHDSLSDLDEQYRDSDGELTFAHGDPVDILQQFHKSGWDIITTADPTGRYGWRRDNAVAEKCDVTFIDADGLTRGVENTRDGWAERVEQWFEEETCQWDSNNISLEYVETDVSVEKISDEYDVCGQKENVPPGGTAAAMDAVDTFLKKLPSYPGSISAPTDARTGTSQLSPYLRFGCVSVRQVYQAINDRGRDGRAKEMFLSRLYWNRHYNQKLADWKGWMDTAANPVMEGFHDESYDPELVQAWKQGETGYPMVDASMRCLQETGWLNFRMRAMCASFLCDLLQQPWKIGADWFYYHLIDADPAINYTQFQIQAGVDGTNMMRVYNPRKQVRDNDPDGEFIQEWVPELRHLPVEHLDKPEKTPVHIQEDCGVIIGGAYPYPVVEYEVARERILQKFEQVKADAKRALQNKEVARRISMPQTGNVEDDPQPTSSEETSDTHQSSLSSF